MMTDPDITAAVLIIGNEVLSGRTKDANLGFLGSELNKIGILVMEARVIRDDQQMIMDHVNDLRRRYDYLFTTGGIGPTHDDITSESIAKAFALPFGRNPDAVRMLSEHYDDKDLTAARLRMANTPEGVILLDNPVSKAPGFQVENVFVLPGVPVIMQAIFAGFRHRLQGGREMLSATLTCDLPEGRIAENLGHIQDRNKDVEIGSYPYIRLGKMGVSVVVRHTDQARLDSVSGEIKAMISGLGGKIF